MADLSNTKPLYLQLVETLETEIREKLEANEKLLSERELTQVYGVSRITVRLALQELEKRGLVYKVHGKGTFVSEVSHQAVDLSMAYSFTDQMRRVGRVPKTQILSFEKIQATDYLAQRLQVAVDDPVFELERLRLADGIPMMLERTYVPAVLFESLSEKELQVKPLYEIFAEDFEQVIRLAEEEFYASIALENEARLLDIQNGDAVLHLIRKTYNDKNRIIEYTFSIARADQFRYKISHTRGEQDSSKLK
ncbi:UTRA domain-containing protein [Streptococcus sp. zg-86]|uniref:UTRA domain-containing protein n=1 Tax=Streptococcus zhangguiae TaxID=2664091 RepID=A0A6I4RID5_9STRE|nr:MULTISPECIES: GntR family transcriptional regulator [unclassified Streptococcus]MTB64274.1 UTRA domain-containing protein [Streptococcus sp. zg-86]MTB90400.1 UTRA domain-containing protein [Streptococcus sp. zg-36]MWV56261.1 UTRA domain-containing protein [Streptococcus sp. zg-70]QTH48701.1 GntR family transcriptional regulator [Streptococcus sp. zg-86]